MTWKEFIEKVEYEVKLLRPDMKLDDMKIYSIDVYGIEEIKDIIVNFTYDGELIIYSDRD